MSKFGNLNVSSLISLIGHNTIKNILLSYIRALICNDYIWKIIFKLLSYSFILGPILKPVLKKDIGLHFLTYFANTSFYLNLQGSLSNSVLSIPDSAIAFCRNRTYIRFFISRIFDDQMHLNSKYVLTPAKHSNYWDLNS